MHWNCLVSHTPNIFSLAGPHFPLWLIAERKFWQADFLQFKYQFLDCFCRVFKFSFIERAYATKGDNFLKSLCKLPKSINLPKELNECQMLRYRLLREHFKNLLPSYFQLQRRQTIGKQELQSCWEASQSSLKEIIRLDFWDQLKFFSGVIVTLKAIFGSLRIKISISPRFKGQRNAYNLIILLNGWSLIWYHMFYSRFEISVERSVIISISHFECLLLTFYHILSNPPQARTCTKYVFKEPVSTEEKRPAFLIFSLSHLTFLLVSCMYRRP